MGEACLRFNTPVTGGNVSFYNQTVKEGKETVPVFPTPTIGMIGLIKDKKKRMTLDFKEKGDLIFLIGESEDDLGCSEYLVQHHGVRLSPAPHFDLEREYAVQRAVLKLIDEGVINAAHDVSDGGLFTTLVEMGLNRRMGFDITSDAAVRMDSFLFGESQSRIITAIDSDNETLFIEMLLEIGVPFTLLGHVTRGKLVVDDTHFGFIDDAAEIYENALGKRLKS